MAISIFKKIYHKLPEPENWKFWVTISLIVKASFLFYYIYLASSLPDDYAGFNYKGSWAKAGGDASSYFDPIENLLTKGAYYDDYRMPGYGWIYFILRFLFNPNIAFNFIIIIQLFFSSVSVYLFGIISSTIFKKGVLFYLCFFFYLFSTFVSINDYVLMTESLAVSTLIFSIYFFIKHFEAKNKTFYYLLLSGLFITWSIFLRPVIAPILILFIIFLKFNRLNVNKKFKQFFIGLLFLTIPFVLIDGLWILRNYNLYKTIIPLQKGRDYDSVVNGYGIHMRNFLRSFGGSAEFWNPHSESIYFTPESDYFYSDIGVDTSLKLINKNIYTSEFNKDSLLELRNIIIDLYQTPDKSKENEIIERFIRYKSSIKNEKPFLYFVEGRFIAFKKMLFQSDYNLGLLCSFSNNSNNISFRLFAYFYKYLYYFTICCGILGLILITLKYIFKNNYIFLIILITCYLLFSYPIIFSENQNRYLVTAYPFLVLTTSYLINLFLKKLKTYLPL